METVLWRAQAAVWDALNRDLLLHLLLLLFIVIIALQCLLGEPLSLFLDLLRYLLMPALGGSIQVADPGQLQLKLLVLVVVVCYVDDACCLLDSLLKRNLTVGKIELLELRLCYLSSFAGSSAVVALVCVRTSGPAISKHPPHPVESTRLDHV